MFSLGDPPLYISSAFLDFLFPFGLGFFPRRIHHQQRLAESLEASSVCCGWQASRYYYYDSKWLYAWLPPACSNQCMSDLNVFSKLKSSFCAYAPLEVSRSIR